VNTSLRLVTVGGAFRCGDRQLDGRAFGCSTEDFLAAPPAAGPPPAAFSPVTIGLLGASIFHPRNTAHFRFTPARTFGDVLAWLSGGHN
jgi:hypothetical protein